MLGVFGYMHFANFEMIDAFENASMILSGMGPVSYVESESGKVFSSCYALFAGVLFMAGIGYILSKIV